MKHDLGPEPPKTNFFATQKFHCYLRSFLAFRPKRYYMHLGPFFLYHSLGPKVQLHLVPQSIYYIQGHLLHLRPQRLNDFHLAFAAHSFDRRQASIKTQEKYSLLIKIYKLTDLQTLKKRCGSKTEISGNLTKPGGFYFGCTHLLVNDKTKIVRIRYESEKITASANLAHKPQVFPVTISRLKKDSFFCNNCKSRFDPVSYGCIKNCCSFYLPILRVICARTVEVEKKAKGIINKQS